MPAPVRILHVLPSMPVSPCRNKQPVVLHQRQSVCTAIHRGQHQHIEIILRWNGPNLYVRYQRNERRQPAKPERFPVARYRPQHDRRRRFGALGNGQR